MTNKVLLVHELWVDSEGLDTFCLAGPDSDELKILMGEGAKLIWTVKAGSHFEAMTKYYNFRGYGEYTTEFEIDKEPYSQELLDKQRSNC